MAANGKRWVPKKLQALMGLVTQQSVAEASQTSGVPARSLYRWLKDNDFREDLHVMRQYIQVYGLNYLRSTKLFVVDALKDVLTDKDVPAKDRQDLGKWFLEFLQKDPIITPQLVRNSYSKPEFHDGGEDLLRVNEEGRWSEVDAEADQFDAKFGGFSALSDEQLAERINELKGEEDQGIAKDVQQYRNWRRAIGKDE